ncbi:LAETG motif-containing sortase-dependent surface protein [Streptomyces sp. NPDC005551]|uniref:LAETG motif-containing sortase-dependent surface protein n=1 Tax=Streptomyces sp. NPDC005551 TaxID=3364725 RepID=UPI0036A03924
MKLRRAMAVTAAAAAIAPLALLSAPTAFAEEPGPTLTPSATVTETVPAPSTPEATPPSSTPAGTPSTAAPSTSAPAASTTPSGTPSATPGDEPTDPEVPYCEDVDEEYGDAKVSADIKGLPGKIVAGSGYHAFELTVTNDSKIDIEGVAFYAEIENYELDESKYLSKYVDLEFKNPESGKWTRIGDDSWAGDYFFYAETLKSKQTESVDLRVSIDKNAPAGDAYSFGSGAYLDNVDGQDCVAEGWAQYDFVVLKPGSENPNPGEAEPGDDDEKDPVKRPQGDVSELPTGSLAETGSSSALPVIGLVGGVAVVAGAGAVFVVRRRKSGDAAA